MKNDSDRDRPELIYADSSALAKLFLSEPESEAFEAFRLRRTIVSSELTRIELLRTARREERLTSRRASVSPSDIARDAIDQLSLWPIDEDVAEVAIDLPHPTLKSFDAIHVATALLIEPDSFVTYDEHQAEAARMVGLNVVSPS